MIHSHVRCVVKTFDKILYEGFILTGHRAVLLFILHKTIFLHFVYHGTKFYDRCIKSDNRKKFSDDDCSGVKQKQKVINNYCSTYHNSYGNRGYVISRY